MNLAGDDTPGPVGKRAKLWGGRLVPWFDHYDGARAAGLHSQTTWRRQGRTVLDERVPAGILVTEQSKARPDMDSGFFPVLANHKDHIVVADNWFRLYSLDQTVCPIEIGKSKQTQPSTTQKGEEKEPGGEGSLMTEIPSQTIVLKGFRTTKLRSGLRSVISVRAYVPEGLNLPGNCPVKEQIWWFLGLVYWKHLEAREAWDRPVHLMYDYLRDNIPDWPAVWRWCDRLGLVERTAGYIPGERAYGYLTASPYRDQTHRLRVFDHKLLAKRLRAVERKHISRPVLVHLRQQLDRLSVDLDGFEERFGDSPNRHYYRAHLQTILDGELRLSRDDFSGRVHTNVTNLYKPLRKCLRVDGEADTLGEVDIRNSQPLFLGLAAKRAGAEDDRYLRLCEAGEIYDHLAARLGVLRASAKQEMMAFLFAKNGYRSTAKAVFGREFPQTAAYVHKVKATDHKRLARHMQEAERRLVVDTVCVRLMRLRKEMFVATIHDSLLARQADGELVVTVLREEFAKHGLRPTLVWHDVAEYEA